MTKYKIWCKLQFKIEKEDIKNYKVVNTTKISLYLIILVSSEILILTVILFNYE